jgi:hypothetical protein
MSEIRNEMHETHGVNSPNGDFSTPVERPLVGIGCG